MDDDNKRIIKFIRRVLIIYIIFLGFIGISSLIAGEMIYFLFVVAAIVVCIFMFRLLQSYSDVIHEALYQQGQLKEQQRTIEELESKIARAKADVQSDDPQKDEHIISELQKRIAHIERNLQLAKEKTGIVQ